MMGTTIDDDWTKFCENENEDISSITPLRVINEKKCLMGSKKITNTVIKKKKQIIVEDIDANATEMGADANEVDANEMGADADEVGIDALAIRKAHNNNICTDLYISTQTKISYLNMPIILND